MQRRAGLSPDGRAGPSMARSTAPVPLRSRRAFPRREAAAGGRSPRCSHTQPGAEPGSGLPPCPGPGQVPPLPPRGRRDIARRNGTHGTPGRRRVPAPGCLCLGHGSGSGTAPPRASAGTAKLTNLGHGRRALGDGGEGRWGCGNRAAPLAGLRGGGSGRAAPPLTHVAIIFSRGF